MSKTIGEIILQVNILREESGLCFCIKKLPFKTPVIGMNVDSMEDLYDRAATIEIKDTTTTRQCQSSK